MSYSNVDKIMEQIKEEKFDIDDIQHLMQELRMLLAEMEDDNDIYEGVHCLSCGEDDCDGLKTECPHSRGWPINNGGKQNDNK